MSEMIERVAEAIYAMARETRDEWLIPDWKMVARAAIEAMREPTSEMTSCSEEVHWGDSCYICGGLKDGWQKMIDAALSSQNGKSL